MLSEISLKLCVQAVLEFKPLFLKCVLLFTFYILNIQVSIVHLPPSPPRLSLWGSWPQVSGLQGLWQVGCCAACWKGGGKRHGFCKVMAAPLCIYWMLPCPSHRRGFRAGTCESPGEDTRSPASGTSLRVPADGVWQHPRWLPVGRDLRGSAPLSSHCCRKRKPLPE